MNENNLDNKVDIGVKQELGGKPEISFKPGLGENTELIHKALESNLKDYKRMTEDLPNSFKRTTEIQTKMDNK